MRSSEGTTPGSRTPLGVAGCDANAGLASGAREACDDAVEDGDLEALLDERVERQVQGPRAGDREVVGRAVNGQRADVAAGKFQRLHGEAVRRDQHIAAVQLDRHRVRLRIEFVAPEVPREDLLDEFAHEAATVAVRQRNTIVFHHEGTLSAAAASCAAWP
jgi:hypothetical protein